MAELVVMNPVARPAERHVRPAPRLHDLRGRTIGLYWNMKAGGDVALDRTEELLRQRFGDVRLKHFIGSMGFLMRHCTAEDAQRIAAECDAVIGTTSD